MVYANHLNRYQILPLKIYYYYYFKTSHILIYFVEFWVACFKNQILIICQFDPFANSKRQVFICFHSKCHRLFKVFSPIVSRVCNQECSLQLDNAHSHMIFVLFDGFCLRLARDWQGSNGVMQILHLRQLLKLFPFQLR